MRKLGITLQQTIPIKFRSAGGDTKAIAAVIGESIMQNARKNRIELESACDGTCTCSTCHVHLPPDVYASVIPPNEAECDMLDTASHRIASQSRLSCQVMVTEKLENVCVDIPDE